MWFSNSQIWEAIATSQLTPALGLPPNSAQAAVGMIARSRQMTTNAFAGIPFSFTRPSSSAAELDRIVEESDHLRIRRVSRLPVQVVQNPDGTDGISKRSRHRTRRSALLPADSAGSK